MILKMYITIQKNINLKIIILTMNYLKNIFFSPSKNNNTIQA